MARLPEQTGVDTLKYCRDLWWWFHEADACAGLRSSMGGQIDAIELGTPDISMRDEPEILLGAARKNRDMYAALKLLSEHDYGVLRVFYTDPHHRPAEVLVAGAHKSFYTIRGDK